ncbi:MAG: type I methionyl aminopeptidase [Thermoflexales bacterium]|nr:type I methionyl aminopeptidase [Thermoflexales bacterium]
MLKSSAEIAQMREAGRIAARALAETIAAVRPGVTTAQLDAVAEKVIRQHGATPSFLGYRPAGSPASLPPFKGSICASVNDEIVHGLPGPRKLREGDIMKIDVGAFYKGFHGDTAWSVPVGAISAQAAELLRVTEQCLYAGIAAARKGNRFGDIGHAIQTLAEGHGFSVIREYTSHGVGRELHEGFSLLNYGEPGTGTLLRPGMTIALEPMINAGGWGTKVKRDLWTVSTIDGKLSAHFEHTIAITDGAAEVLTRLEAGS